MAKKKRTTRSSTNKASEYCVFISHATHDKWIAKVICEKIEELGVQTFRDDRDIQGGDNIPDAIKAAIRSCDEMLILLTPVSIKRIWVTLEIGMASMVERRIVPILYHIDADQIIGIISDNRGYRLDEFDDYLTGLEQRVKGTE